MQNSYNYDILFVFPYIHVKHIVTMVWKNSLIVLYPILNSGAWLNRSCLMLLFFDYFEYPKFINMKIYSHIMSLFYKTWNKNNMMSPFLTNSKFFLKLLKAWYISFSITAILLVMKIYSYMMSLSF